MLDAVASVSLMSDEEEALQVHHDDGRWHRRTPDIQYTACGKPIYRLGQNLRHDSYQGPICDQCFTPFEMSISEAIERAEQELARGGGE